jgi:hypothetical protein
MPKLQFFHRELGVALFKTGELAESKKELDQALTLDPKMPEPIIRNFLFQFLIDRQHTPDRLCVQWPVGFSAVGAT